MLTDTLLSGKEKETYYIIAAMHYYLDQKDSSWIYLNKAQLLTFKNKNLVGDGVNYVDEYLTEQILSYKNLIRKERNDELKRKLKLYFFSYWHWVLFSMIFLAFSGYLIKRSVKADITPRSS